MVRGFSDTETNMKCIHCQGEMRQGRSPLHVDHKGCHLVLDDVPAWICQQCGETYFEEREAKAIQELLKSIEQKSAELMPAK